MPELSLAPFYQIDPPSDTLFARLVAAEAMVTELSSECTQLATQAQTIQKKLNTVSALLANTIDAANEICE